MKFSLPMMLIRRTLGLRPLVDLEHHVDAILVELDDLRLDAGGVAALAAVELDDPGDVGAGACERVKIWRGASLISGVILSSLMRSIALENDAVDDRILADLDHQIAGIGAGDGDVGEQIGGVAGPAARCRAAHCHRARRCAAWCRRARSPARSADCRSPSATRMVRWGWACTGGIGGNCRTSGAGPAAGRGLALGEGRRGQAAEHRPNQQGCAISTTVGENSVARHASAFTLRSEQSPDLLIPVSGLPCPIRVSRSSRQASQRGQKRPGRSK